MAFMPANYTLKLASNEKDVEPVSSLSFLELQFKAKENELYARYAYYLGLLFAKKLVLQNFKHYAIPLNEATQTYFFNDSVVGGLASGRVDAYLATRMSIAGDRWRYLTYTTVTNSERHCFYIKKKEKPSQNDLFFFEPLLQGVLILTGFLLLLTLPLFILKLKVSRLRYHQQIGIPLDMFAECWLGYIEAIVLGIFVTLLKVDLTPHASTVKYFSTAGELANLIEAGRYYMVMDSYNNTRTEFLSNTTVEGYDKLSKALQKFPIVRVQNVSEVCRTLNTDPQAVTFHSEESFLRDCSRFYYNITEICPHDAPFYLQAFGFGKESPFIEDFNRVAEFVYVINTVRYRPLRMQRVLYEMRTKHDDRNFVALSLQHVHYLFRGLIACLAVSVIVFVSELHSCTKKLWNWHALMKVSIICTNQT